MPGGEKEESQEFKKAATTLALFPIPVVSELYIWLFISFLSIVSLDSPLHLTSPSGVRTTESGSSSIGPRLLSEKVLLPSIFFAVPS